MKAAPRILLINPNSSVATTQTMVEIARQTAGSALDISGATATRAPLLITTPRALEDAGSEVVEIAAAQADSFDGFIVSAFGDPGLDTLRARVGRLAVGIANAAIVEAASHGRRFGIATTTPELETQIVGRVGAAGLSSQFTGVRFTTGDPAALMSNGDALMRSMATVIRGCIEEDGAEAIIIGGGPLARIAQALQFVFAAPIIAPIPAATRAVLASL
jgi:allantoin racemase